MKTYLSAIVFLFAYTSAFAQQLPLFTQYREYSGILNPAAVPNDYLWYEKNLSFGASYRKQWLNDSEGPATQVIRGDYVWLRDNVHPIFGGYLMNDKAARMGMTGAYGRMGILFSDSPLERGISAGLSAGVVRYGLDLNNPRVEDPSDPALFDVRNKIFPDVSAGVYAYTTFDNGHLLYGGASVPQVLGLDLRFRDKSDNTLSLQRSQHFYATAGYKISLRDEYSFLEFSTWVKYVPALKPHFDCNVRYQMSETLFIGTGMSSSGNFHIETGLLMGEDKLFRIGMGADVPFTRTSAYYGAALEFNCAYALER